MTALNPMLTLVTVPCVRCGSTAETVARDRELLGKTDGECCEVDNPPWRELDVYRKLTGDKTKGCNLSEPA